MVELGPHLATERARVETPHLPVRAPGIYPDIRSHGSVGPRRSREDDHLGSAGVTQRRNDRERVDLER